MSGAGCSNLQHPLDNVLISSPSWDVSGPQLEMSSCILVAQHHTDTWPEISGIINLCRGSWLTEEQENISFPSSIMCDFGTCPPARITFFGVPQEIHFNLVGVRAGPVRQQELVALCRPSYIHPLSKRWYAHDCNCCKSLGTIPTGRTWEYYRGELGRTTERSSGFLASFLYLLGRY